MSKKSDNPSIELRFAKNTTSDIHSKGFAKRVHYKMSISESTLEKAPKNCPFSRPKYKKGNFV